jgi:hypothetical protein
MQKDPALIARHMKEMEKLNKETVLIIRLLDSSASGMTK